MRRWVGRDPNRTKSDSMPSWPIAALAAEMDGSVDRRSTV
jgi:hypothetical protein